MGRVRTAFWRAGRHALELHAYGAALHFCEAALELWPDDGDRPRIAAAAARARYHFEGDTAELTAAIDALEAAGDPEGAAEAAALAANAAWRAGRRPEAEALIDRAERLLAGRVPTPALCAVLAEKARLVAYVAPDAAEPIAREALELVERLELPGLRASLLATLANIYYNRADYAAAARAYEDAIAAAPPGSPEMVRATSNRSLLALSNGDGADALAWLDRAAEVAARVGDRPGLMWVEAGLIVERYYKLGRWDEALNRIAAALADAERTGGSYMEPMFRLARAVILASRGDERQAVTDVEAALARVDDTADIQFQARILSEGALVHALLGDIPRARELLARLRNVVGQVSPRFAPPFTADIVAMFARCGYADEWLARFADSVVTPRLTAARLVWQGRAAEAADIYAAAAPEEEACARLLAAEQLAAQGRTEEAAAQLERGLAFYRAVGATRVVHHAESLVAAAS